MSTQGAKLAVAKELESAYETCGFAVHVMAVLTAMLYILWMGLSATDDLETSHHLGDDEQGSYPSSRDRWLSWVRMLLLSILPHPAWLKVLPIVASALFVAAPCVYGALNTLIATPPMTSIHSVQDDDYYVSAPSHVIQAANKGQNTTPGTPTICDLDVAIINDLIWKQIQSEKSK